MITYDNPLLTVYENNIDHVYYVLGKYRRTKKIKDDIFLVEYDIILKSYKILLIKEHLSEFDTKLFWKLYNTPCTEPKEFIKEDEMKI